MTEDYEEWYFNSVPTPWRVLLHIIAGDQQYLHTEEEIHCN